MPKAALGHAQPPGLGNRERSLAQLWGQGGFARHLPMVSEIPTPPVASSTGPPKLPDPAGEPDPGARHTAVRSQQLSLRGPPDSVLCDFTGGDLRLHVEAT